MIKKLQSLRSGWAYLLDIKNWHPQQALTQNLFTGLDGIRGIAILLVVAAHTIPFLYMDTPLKRWLSVVSSNGTLGVWLFFVLSGFLISLPFFKRLNSAEWCPPGYLLRRASKIIPPLYLSIVCLTAFVIWESGNWNFIRGALEAMFFVEIFHTPEPLLTPIYWTLAAEVTFYCTLPIIFLLRLPRRFTSWLVPIFFISVSTLVWLAFAGKPEIVATCPFVRDVLLSFGFFGWGTLFSCFYLSIPKERIQRSGLIVLIGFLGFVLCCAASTQYFLNHQRPIDGLVTRLAITNAVGASAFLMLFVVYQSKAIICRLLSYPTLAFAGLISYEWYLFHLLFIGFSNLITGDNLHGDYGKLLIRILFSFPLAFLFSALFYRTVSLPILRRAHSAGRPKRGPG